MDKMCVQTRPHWGMLLEHLTQKSQLFAICPNKNKLQRQSDI